MLNPLSDERLARIFKRSTRNPALIRTNEGTTIEYKQSFGWLSLSEYLKAMAAFANRDGGYIIFGVKDKPHTLLGLKGKALENFESIDNQKWSTNIREHFAPEIFWDKRAYVFDGEVYGVLYTYPAREKPIICKKDTGELRKAAIYYRYNSQNAEIDYPELHTIIENEKRKIDEQWMKMIRQIGDSGVSRTALLDLGSGKMTGANTTLYIDEDLLGEISFVQEGSFVETGGNPALKLVGEVQTVVGAQRVVVEQDRNKAINTDEIIKSFITQEMVNNPAEFVKQICYSTTGNLPVYYFLNLAKMSTETGVTLIDEVPVNSTAKELLKRRIVEKETKFYRISNTNSSVTKKKREYLQNIVDENVSLPSEDTELKYFLMAIRGMDAKQIAAHKAYILNLLYEIYTTYFNSIPYASIKPEFRYTLCWVDEALYMQTLTEKG